jgi:hypothetical protein
MFGIEALCGQTGGEIISCFIPSMGPWSFSYESRSHCFDYVILLLLATTVLIVLFSVIVQKITILQIDLSQISEIQDFVAV